ncbi:MAG: VOC family protein [Nostoc sp. DedQUE12b]|uniref:VOC family protein n=1 Tax=Nostoc sp. DedQUE12b TaxID=3075398 RepID=UPI002AD3B074|nr:VOC family protein [Nostoc sp. DedQUE12b]MDZ8085466.1 VOC family protein [Nostoc sp. DedQUE12b]
MTNKIALNLWKLLWQEYSARVNYARTYQQMITAAGGTVANDHIAFRSLRLLVDTPQGQVNLGIDYLGQLAEALGYVVAGEYTFAQTYLYARHYRHPQQEEFNLPKLFISELIVDELPSNIAQLISTTVSSIPKELTSPLTLLQKDGNIETIAKQLQQVFTRPWLPPQRSVVEEVNQVTQYGAWVLLHGYAVNHFTGYVNGQNTPKYPDIDTTASALANLGVPMKAEIEGNIACGLRQTATQAVTEMVTVLDDNSGAEIQIPWTYAYYEIAQRYLVEVESGKQVLFDAFLGSNAQQLFEMTRLSK